MFRLILTNLKFLKNPMNLKFLNYHLNLKFLNYHLNLTILLRKILTLFIMRLMG
jgi:hypothetical protein